MDLCTIQRNTNNKSSLLLTHITGNWKEILIQKHSSTKEILVLILKKGRQRYILLFLLIYLSSDIRFLLTLASMFWFFPEWSHSYRNDVIIFSVLLKLNILTKIFIFSASVTLNKVSDFKRNSEEEKDKRRRQTSS